MTEPNVVHVSEVLVARGGMDGETGCTINMVWQAPPGLGASIRCFGERVFNELPRQGDVQQMNPQTATVPASSQETRVKTAPDLSLYAFEPG